MDSEIRRFAIVAKYAYVMVGVLGCRYCTRANELA
jgi:hypothetical protein